MTDVDLATVNTEAMATQALLVGLMLGLKEAGIAPAALEKAFEFAENLAITMAYKDATPIIDAAHMTDVFDQLHKIVFRP